ncbi:MAG: hypothetical protein AAFW84_35025 [Cyanobacteria bacterium J06635_15]
MTAPAPQFSAEGVQETIDAILNTLGKPATPAQTEALSAFNSGDDKSVRILAASHLNDNFIKALGYLVSAPKLLPTTPSFCLRRPDQLPIMCAILHRRGYSPIRHGSASANAR